jgi:hypothetical protein
MLTYRDEIAFRLNQLVEYIRMYKPDFDKVIFCKLLGISNVYDLEKHLYIFDETLKYKDINNNTKLKTKSISIKGMLGITNGETSISASGEFSTSEKYYKLDTKNRINFDPKDLLYPPPLELLEKIANIFDLNENWLLRGKEKPFKPKRIYLRYPGELLELIYEPPLKYYFILSEQENREFAIIIHQSHFKFTITSSFILDAYLPWSDKQWQRDMESLCVLIEKLKQCNSKIEGKVVNKKFFDDLNKGTIPLGSITNYEIRNSTNYVIKDINWQDDILDLSLNEGHLKKITFLYGEWFNTILEAINQIRKENISRMKYYKDNINIM